MYKKTDVAMFIFTLIALAVFTVAGTYQETPKDYQNKLVARVVQVKDGDTVVVDAETEGHFIICRLYGIDAPEIEHRGKPGQPYG